MIGTRGLHGNAGLAGSFEKGQRAVYPDQIHLPSLLQVLSCKLQTPYVLIEPTLTTVHLEAMGAYGRPIVVQECFWSHGMSQAGVLLKAGPALVRLSQLIDRIIASQLEHANTYRGQS